MERYGAGEGGREGAEDREAAREREEGESGKPGCCQVTVGRSLDKNANNQ